MSTYWFYTWWEKARSPFAFGGWNPVSEVSMDTHPIEAFNQLQSRKPALEMVLFSWREITVEEYRMFPTED